jgi:Flp pilus assembly protein TadG
MRPKSPISFRPRYSCDSGSAAVELGVIILPAIILALGAFDYFAAGYAITNLEGAARAVGEYARNSSGCAADPTGTDCSTGIATLFNTMQTNNNSLSGATQSTTTYYTCADNAITTSSGPCSVSCGTGCTDTRVLQYASVTVQQAWWKLFSWDPWSSTNKLTARMSTRIQ